MRAQPFTHKFRERYTQKRVALSREELDEPWNVRDGRTTKVVREDTGELILALQSEEYGVKGEWKDRAGEPLEDQLGTLVAEIETLAEHAKEVRAKREDEERRQAIKAREQYELEQRRKLDQNRFKRLRELAERRAEAERIRDFLSALRDQAGPVPSPELAAWFAWAKAQTETLDPLSHGIEAIKSDVEAVTAWTYS